MGLLTFFPTSSETQPNSSSSKKTSNKQKHLQHPSSWNHFKNLLSCKQTTVFDPSKKPINLTRSSCPSICNFTDVVHCNTARVVHRADNSPESSSLGQDSARILTRKPAHGSSSNRSLATSLRSTATCRSLSSTVTSTTTTSSSRMQLRKLSGCYECHMIVDPSRYPIAPRSTVCACSQCGEIFPKIESLEHHQAVRHAGTELFPPSIFF